MAPHWLTRRILLPVTAATVILVAAVLLLFVLLIRHQAQQELERSHQAARQYWAVDVRHHITKLEGVLTALTQSPALRTALAAGDRAALQRDTTQLFQELDALHGFDRLGFLDTEGRVLLRQHKLSAQNAQVDSQTIQRVMRERRLVGGLVVGPDGLALKVAMPVKHDGRLAGYVVVGESLEHVLEHLDTLFRLQHVVVIDKSYLAQRGIAVAPNSWGDRAALPSHVLLRGEVEKLPAELRELLRHEELDALGEGRLVECDGCYNFVAALPLADQAGETLGHTILLRDVTAARASLMQTIYSVVAMTLFITAVLLGLLYRVTRRVEVEQHALYMAVADGRRAWQDAFDAIREPIFLHDHEFRIVRANRAYAELAGMDVREVIGRPYWEVFPKGEGPLPKCGAALKDTKSLEVGEEQEEEIRLPDGRFFLSRAFYTTHPDGSFQYSVHVLEDMTEREVMADTLRRENRLRRIISASNQTLIRSDNEAALLEAICRIITEEADYPLAWVGLRENDARQSLRPAAVAGLPAQEWGLLPNTWAKTPGDDNPAAYAIRRGERVLVPDVMVEGTCESCRRLAERLGYRSVLVFPLKDREETFGALTIAAAEVAAFSEVEIELLAELAGDLAYGVNALRSERRRRKAIEAHQQVLLQLESSLDKTVMVMAHAMETRDPYTAGHQDRVAQLAKAIAEFMDLPPAQVEAIHVAATIHDIGKIHIPAEILSKPGRLSAIEFELIKTHSAVGYELLKDIDFPWPVAQMVRQHHERLDGSGYPDAINGDAILFEARIIAVADVMEAMASHRPYRPALPLDKALDELESHKGTHYDARVVEACVSLFREQGFMWQAHSWG